MAAVPPPHPDPETGEVLSPRNHAARRDPAASAARSRPRTSSARWNSSWSAAISWARSWWIWALIAQRDVLAALSDQLDVPLVAVDGAPPSAPEIEGLSHRFLRQCRAIPGRAGGQRADHRDGRSAGFRDDRRGARVQRPARSAPRWPANRRSSTRSTGITARREQRTYTGEGDDEQADADLEHLRDMASEAPVIRLVNAMIAEAIEKRASDIHIEPFEKEFRVRFRVDGVLFSQEPPPRELKAAIISRLKLMAKLNIAERRLPQDGRIKIKVLGREVDLRVSTLPTLYGESVVMRLLDRSAGRFLRSPPAGFRRPHAVPHGALHQPAARHFPGDGADGQRQIDHALFGAEAHQSAGQEDHHDRRSGGIPDGRDQPDPRESADRADLRQRGCGTSSDRIRM